MILTVLLGALAGWGAVKAEPQIRKTLENLLMAEQGLTEVESNMFALAICLLGAAIVASLADQGNGVALTLGGVLGVMATRLIERAKAGR